MNTLNLILGVTFWILLPLMVSSWLRREYVSALRYCTCQLVLMLAFLPVDFFRHDITGLCTDGGFIIVLVWLFIRLARSA